MARHTVCDVASVSVGTLTPVTIGPSAVLLVRLPSGEIKAITGRCPHQGAPLERGCITGATAADGASGVCFERPGEILRCPWHGFEFDLVTGRPLVESPTMRLREYRVEIEGDRVVVVT